MNQLLTSRKVQVGLLFIILVAIGCFLTFPKIVAELNPDNAGLVGQHLFGWTDVLYAFGLAFGITVWSRLYQANKIKQMKVASNKLASCDRKLINNDTITFLLGLQELLKTIGGLIPSLLIVVILSILYYLAVIAKIDWWAGYSILLIAYAGGNVDGKTYIGTFGDGTA
jgi:hypothetical protein